VDIDGALTQDGGAVFNEASADVDFKVKSNGNANMLFVDGGENRVGIGATGGSQTGSKFYVEGRTALYNGSVTGGSVLITDAYTPSSNDHILNIGTQRSSGGPFIAYGLGHAQNSDALWKSTYDNFSGSHSVLVLNGSTLEYYLDASNSQTTVGDTVAVKNGYKVGRSGTVFNDDGYSEFDFRVESNTASHTLFVQASNGRVGINESNPTAQLYVSTNANTTEPMAINDTGANGASAKHRLSLKYQTTEVGSIKANNSATTFNTSSDQRLKENIADADDAGSKIDAIQVRQFDWKVDGSHQDYGMVAQELLEVAPEAVARGETQEEMMGVDYSKLVPMLIKEIQSLRQRVAQLED